MSEQGMNSKSKDESIQSVLSDHEDKTKQLIARFTAELGKDESLDVIFQKLEDKGIVFSSMEKNKVIEAQSVDNRPDKQNQLAQNQQQTQEPTVQEQDEGR